MATISSRSPGEINDDLEVIEAELTFGFDNFIGPFMVFPNMAKTKLIIQPNPTEIDNMVLWGIRVKNRLRKNQKNQRNGRKSS